MAQKLGGGMGFGEGGSGGVVPPQYFKTTYSAGGIELYLPIIFDGRNLNEVTLIFIN